MKALLMYPERDFESDASLRENADDLMQDLELASIINTAAQGDKLVWHAVSRALLGEAENAATIAHRQEILTDCRAAPEMIRELYALAAEAVQAERRVLPVWSRDEPSAVVTNSVATLEATAEFMERLRAIADQGSSSIQSPGLRRFFAMISEELDDDYLAGMHEHLDELRFPHGEMFSARLGSVNRGTRYVARQAPDPGVLGRLGLRRSGYGFTIPDRDQAGAEALREMENRGLRDVAAVVGQARDHVKAFFAALRDELAFYIGALNLGDALGRTGAPLSTPSLAEAGEMTFAAEDLYDVALALALGRAPVPNNVDARNRPLILITGANQGGKSTLLRAIGQAQLMAQAGLQVGAGAMRLNLCSGVFTHYKRKEDASMESGKLDEELSRMSRIADQITTGALLLCNESFASTNEREGSEIARQIVRAMLDRGIKVVFVTHQYDLAGGFWSTDRGRALFLRAERDERGERTYRVSEGEPLPTSYGADSYRAVFGRTLSRCGEAASSGH
jgi:hypothetical protein